MKYKLCHMNELNRKGKVIRPPTCYLIKVKNSLKFTSLMFIQNARKCPFLIYRTFGAKFNLFFRIIEITVDKLNF